MFLELQSFDFYFVLFLFKANLPMEFFMRQNFKLTGKNLDAKGKMQMKTNRAKC